MGTRRTTGVMVLIVFFSLLSTFPDISAEAPRSSAFHREVIRLEPLPASLHVTGFYVFRNEGEKEEILPVFYPFPVDSRHPFPHQVTVFTETDTLAVRENGNGVDFKLRAAAGGETAFTVDYRQRCVGDSGCYILTTTRAWKKALARADFEIVLADSVALLWISYTPDDTLRTENGRVLRFTRHDFMPDRDLCLSWGQLER